MLRKIAAGILGMTCAVVQCIYAVEQGNKMPCYSMDQIVVTAAKCEKNIKDAPGSIDVVTKDDIQKQNVKDIDEAVRLIPGVYDQKRKGFADIMPSINIRGIYGTNRNLILIDGQPVSEDVWRRFPLELVERIEVVKGPFSNLYGSNAMGGVVNVITKKSKDKLDVKINAGVESYNTQSCEILCFGKSDKWLYAVSARNRKTDGYESNFVMAKTVVSQAAKPVSGTEVKGAENTTDKYGSKTYLIGDSGQNYYHDSAYHFKLGREFSKDTNLQIDYTRTDYEYGYRGGRSYLANSAGNNVNSGSVYFYDNSDARWKRMTLTSTDFESSYGGNKIDLVNLSAETKMSDITIKGCASYDHNDYWWVQPSLTTAYVQPSWNTKKRIEFSAAKHFFSNQTLITGVELKNHEYGLNQYSLLDWHDKNSKVSITQDMIGKTDTAGIFIQDEIELLEPLTVYLGGRYDIWRAYDGYNFIIKSNVSTTYRFDEKNASCFSPRASVVYKFINDSRLKASIGQSFRGPTPSELFSGYVTAAGTSLPNTELKPEKVVSIELGYEQSFTDKVFCKAAYFYNEMNDYIYTKSLNSDELSAYNTGNGTNYTSVTQKQNIGKSKSQGIEFETRMKLLNVLSAFAGSTLMKTEVVENPTNTTSEGKKIPNIPETTADTGIDYSYKGFTAGVIGRYISKIYSADDNSDTAEGVFGGYDSCFLMDAKVSYSMKIADFTSAISLTCDNMFDKKYYQYYLSPGRTYGVNLTISRKF